MRNSLLASSYLHPCLMPSLEKPERPRECGPYADDFDHYEKPCRVQMNVTIADEIKERFAEAVEADNKTMQFVVDDLLRLYLRDREE